MVEVLFKQDYTLWGKGNVILFLGNFTVAISFKSLFTIFQGIKQYFLFKILKRFTCYVKLIDERKGQKKNIYSPIMTQKVNLNKGL